MNRRALMIILGIILLVLPLTADAGPADIASGVCGKNLTWRLDQDYVLTISGTGEMDNYGTRDRPPWGKWEDKITKIVIGDGVTSIGAYVFYYCRHFKSIIIPSSVTDVYESAFSDTDLPIIEFPEGLKRIHKWAFSYSRFYNVSLPTSLESIGFHAFGSIAANLDIFYAGTKEQWKKIKIDSDNSAINADLSNVHFGQARKPITKVTVSPRDTFFLGIGQSAEFDITYEPWDASYTSYESITANHRSGIATFGYYFTKTHLRVEAKSPGKSCWGGITEDGSNITFEVVAYVCRDGWNYFEEDDILVYFENNNTARGWKNIDDKWYYFDPYTGIAKTGLAEDPRNGWVLLYNGETAANYSGLWNDPETGWWLVRNGKVDFGYNGIWNDPACGWVLIQGGTIAQNYSGLWNDPEYGWWLIRDGAVDFGYTGLYCDANVGWWLLGGGTVAWDYNGLWNDPDTGWWLIRNGTIAWDYTGLWNDPTYGWWLLGGGHLADDYTGLWNDPSYGWWLIGGGSIAWDYTGLWNDPTYGWWLINAGSLAWDYNGLWNDPVYGTWMIRNGTI